MKVILSNYDSLKNPFYSGGGAIATHKLASHLAKKHEVLLLCGRYPNYKNGIYDGVQYKHIGLSYGGSKIGQLAYVAMLPLTVLTSVFDIWIESFTPPFSTTVLPLFTKKPVIGLVHMLSGEDMKRKYKLPFPAIEKIGIKTYKHIIVTTNEVKEKITSYNTRLEIGVFPNGIDLPTKPVKRVKKHILFIGRIEVSQKGLDLLLKAYKKVEDKVNYPLVIAGTGEKREMQSLIKLIAKLHLTKRVKLAGYIKNEKKQKFLEEALYVVIPSRFETFCMVVLDAFANGIPVLMFDISGLSWVPKRFSLKVKSIDADSLAVSIEKMTNDDALRGKKSDGVKEYIKQFEWKHVLKRYEEYLTKIANKEYGKIH